MLASASPTFALPETDASATPKNSSARSDVLATKPLEGFSNPLIMSDVKNDTSTSDTRQCEPIVELPASPSHEDIPFEIDDIEDFGKCKSDDYCKEDDMEELPH